MDARGREPGTVDGHATLMERLRCGEPRAFDALGRLVVGALCAQRAYGLREEWPDIVQDVLLAVTLVLRRDAIEDPRAFVAFVRAVTRNKLFDRLRRRPLQSWSAESLEHMSEFRVSGPAPRDEILIDVRDAIGGLPEHKRRAIVEVYVEGRTYVEASAELRIPLGTLKRHLRDALNSVRRALTTGVRAPGAHSPSSLS